jgi:riboflavin kinase, archaea type
VVVLRATIFTGQGEATAFTDLPWVRQQLREQLKLEICSGTLNARPTDATDRAAWKAWRQGKGTPLQPPDPAACTASCWPIRLGADLRGAVIVPHVPGYPTDQIEIVAPVHLRTTLGLRDGDTVDIQLEDA